MQDCLDEAKLVGKFVDILFQYEKLYPYKVFASSEYVISKLHCSICGKLIQSFACPYRKGKLYWGDFEVEVVDEIKKYEQLVSLVIQKTKDVQLNFKKIRTYQKNKNLKSAV